MAFWEQDLERWCPIQIVDESTAPKTANLVKCLKIGFQAGYEAGFAFHESGNTLAKMVIDFDARFRAVVPDPKWIAIVEQARVVERVREAADARRKREK